MNDGKTMEQHAGAPDPAMEKLIDEGLRVMGEAMFGNDILYHSQNLVQVSQLLDVIRTWLARGLVSQAARYASLGWGTVVYNRSQANSSDRKLDELIACGVVAVAAALLDCSTVRGADECSEGLINGVGFDRNIISDKPPYYKQRIVCRNAVLRHYLANPDVTTTVDNYLRAAAEPQDASKPSAEDVFNDALKRCCADIKNDRTLKYVHLYHYLYDSGKIRFMSPTDFGHWLQGRTGVSWETVRSHFRGYERKPADEPLIKNFGRYFQS